MTESSWVFDAPIQNYIQRLKNYKLQIPNGNREQGRLDRNHQGNQKQVHQLRSELARKWNSQVQTPGRASHQQWQTHSPNIPQRFSQL